MLLFGIMTGGVYAMYRGRWTAVHLAILVLFVVKLYFQLINYSFKGNFDYYHNLFCIIYLFSSHKKFFCRLGLVSLYFLSTASKITSSWILGEYFTALKTGLPIFPRGTEPVMTNLVIGMEMVGSWFLFNRTRFVQRAVLGFFVIFHLYSGILVGYHYPTIVLPPLLILFGPWFDASGHHVPLDRTAIVGWSVVSSLLLLQFIPHLIEGDERLTLEGNFFGVYMFEANHQCYGTITRDNEVVERFSEANAWRRCDPYAVWMRAKQAYCSDKESKYRLAFNHSINGEPFREIVNEPDLCRLKYYPFSRNTWIKDEKAAPAVGRPVQNFYR
ncbi:MULTISPECIES: hypothetical protein [unclassified Bradyrhizobium]|uniref:hypothetical protein n=1 Tax=unclassified Bradyrhizobium TaxID=2631580 RepID=UPI002916D913|nr:MULTISPECIES: hypothetical protein [unclassified Bradyrhizobium]